MDIAVDFGHKDFGVIDNLYRVIFQTYGFAKEILLHLLFSNFISFLLLFFFWNVEILIN